MEKFEQEVMKLRHENEIMRIAIDNALYELKKSYDSRFTGETEELLKEVIRPLDIKFLRKLRSEMISEHGTLKNSITIVNDQIAKREYEENL